MTSSILATVDTKLEDGGGIATSGEQQTGDDREIDFLQIAQTADAQGTAWIDHCLRKDWEQALDHFHGRHGAGSKYASSAYAGRSKLFRPKTRSTTVRAEAACAAAFFSTADVVSITAENDETPEAAASAALTQDLLQYRLTKSIPWFLIVQGQFQTTRVMGICASKQYWKYKQVPVHEEFELYIAGTQEPILDPATGQPRRIKKKRMEVVEDKPCVEPIPPDQLLLHPGCDWLDPVGSSPYVVHKIPMYAGEIKARIAAGEWLGVADSMLRGNSKFELSSLRSRRTGGQDPLGSEAAGAPSPIDDHELVWVHENIVRVAEQDWHFFTVGAQVLLSTPRPLDEVYWHGKRPFAVGYGSIEAFNPWPKGKAVQTRDLQIAANEIQNQRLDNVKLSMNARYFVREGRGVDLQALQRSVPGGGVLMKDPETDVKVDRPPEVTASSYQEQDRINVDYDDLAGSFSQSSVMTNRKLNETVGGMAMLSNSANAVLEYELRVFSETYIEKVLRQLVQLEQRYETDEKILALAGRKARVVQRYGVDPLMDGLLDQDLSVTVNVGTGSIDPMQRLAKIVNCFDALFKVMEPVVSIWGPGALGSPGFEQITAEIFGAAGYKDGKRFLDFGPLPQPPGPPEGPPPELMAQMEEMQGVIEQLQQQLMMLKQGDQTKLQIEDMKQQGADRREVIKQRGKFASDILKVAAQPKPAPMTGGQRPAYPAAWPPQRVH